MSGTVERLNEKTKDERKSRNDISRGRTEIDKRVKEGTYIEWLKKEHGVMDEKELMLDSGFFNEIIREIERNRERKMVYDYHYKRQHLDEWIRRNNKKDLMRRLAEVKREKLKKTGGLKLNSYEHT